MDHHLNEYTSTPDVGTLQQQSQKELTQAQPTMRYFGSKAKKVKIFVLSVFQLSSPVAHPVSTAPIVSLLVVSLFVLLSGTAPA